jgi:putative transposase
LKNERFRDKAPRNVDEARRVVDDFVIHYNEVRLHSALGYVTPVDKLAGRDTEIYANRDSKLEAARAQRLGAKSRARAEASKHTVLM